MIIPKEVLEDMSFGDLVDELIINRIEYRHRLNTPDKEGTLHRLDTKEVQCEEYQSNITLIKEEINRREKIYKNSL